jgi:hypothetical protein
VDECVRTANKASAPNEAHARSLMGYNLRSRWRATKTKS